MSWRVILAVATTMLLHAAAKFMSTNSTPTTPLPPIRPSTTISPPPTNTPSTQSTLIHPTASWGDNVHHDPDNLFRIYYQNVQGIHASLDDIDAHLQSMDNIMALRNQISILLIIQESHNYSNSKPSVFGDTIE